jgi:hypothetical protein
MYTEIVPSLFYAVYIKPKFAKYIKLSETQIKHCWIVVDIKGAWKRKVLRLRFLLS